MASGAPVRLPMDLSSVRRHHLSVVLEHLVRNGPRSRAAIAQETGLTKSTVSALVADLLERELVEELDTPRAGRVGRPAVDVGVAGRRVGALGLSIDVDSVAACIVDVSGDVRVVRRRNAANRDARASQVVTRLRAVTTRAVDAADALGIRCIGAALALPGLVDAASRTLFVAPNLHWFDADLAALTGDLGLPTGLPMAVDNEANLGALAELRHGAGRDVSSFVYVSAGVGVGAGIVVDGRVVRGAHGFAGELGHVVVDPDGRRCACGARGCLETIIGADRHATLDRAADALAVALRSVVHLVDPDAVVLGGALTAYDDALAGAVAERLCRTTLGARWHACAVRMSAISADSPLLGAATTALDAVVADPTLVPLRVSSQSA